MSKINILVVFLLILMALSPIVAAAVDAQIIPLGVVDFALVPSASEVEMGKSFYVDVMMGSGRSLVGGGEFVVQWGPSVIMSAKIVPGTHFDSVPGDLIIVKQDNRTNRVELLFIATERGKGFSGEGSVARIYFNVSMWDVEATAKASMSNILAADLKGSPYETSHTGCEVDIKAVLGEDNCPDVPSRNQGDKDEDGWGDVCDNCPLEANADQADTDGDGTGDVCDVCPLVSDRQEDYDGDGIGDKCDACPRDPVNDEDRDGVCGDVDNRPGIYNPSQSDPVPERISRFFSDEINQQMIEKMLETNPRQFEEPGAPPVRYVVSEIEVCRFGTCFTIRYWSDGTEEVL